MSKKQEATIQIKDLKLNDTIKVTFKDYYRGESSVCGLLIDCEKGTTYNQDQTRLTLLSPVATKNYNDHIEKMWSDKIVKIEKIKIPGSVLSLMKKMIKMKDEKTALEKKVDDLRIKMSGIQDNIESLKKESIELYAKSSKDVSVWKQKIQNDISKYDDSNRVLVYVKNVTMKKVSMMIQFSKSVQVLSKELEDRIRGDECVNKKEIDYYTPDKERYVKYELPKAIIVSIKKSQNEQEKGWVDFCQNIEIEIPFDMKQYDSWIKELNDGLGKLAILSKR